MITDTDDFDLRDIHPETRQSKTQHGVTITCIDCGKTGSADNDGHTDAHALAEERLYEQRCTHDRLWAEMRQAGDELRAARAAVQEAMAKIQPLLIRGDAAELPIDAMAQATGVSRPTVYKLIDPAEG